MLGGVSLLWVIAVAVVAVVVVVVRRIRKNTRSEFLVGNQHELRLVQSSKEQLRSLTRRKLNIVVISRRCVCKVAFPTKSYSFFCSLDYLSRLLFQHATDIFKQQQATRANPSAIAR